MMTSAVGWFVWRRCLLAVAVAVVVVGCAEAERTAEAPSQERPPGQVEVAQLPDDDHDVTGAYFPLEALPPEFAQLDHLHLATIDGNADPAPLNGFLRPHEPTAQDYRLVEPRIDGRRLSFTTTPVDGVAYDFTGAFERTTDFAENPPEHDEVVLAGTLTKRRNGTVAATTPVSFRYYAGD
jgi:hypothetical protein